MSSAEAHQAYCVRPGDGQLLPTGQRLKVSSAQSGGALEVFEFGAGSPPPHIHNDHEECFYILEGVYTFTLGTEQVEAPAGSVVFVPRGTRHAFKRGENGRALLFVVPAGLAGFFQELGQGLAAGGADAELRDALSSRYDSEPAA